MSQLTRAMTALSFGLLAAPSSAEYRPDLVFHGACAAQSFLNGVRFANVGRTYHGAPYYKGTTTDGVEQYIYWDPDCAASGDGAARWIVGAHAPDVTRIMDLDGDGTCDYHARIDSTHKEFPPPNALWTMRCGAPTSESMLVDLAAITTTETRTSTTFSTSSRTISTSTTTRSSTTTSSSSATSTTYTGTTVVTKTTTTTPTTVAPTTNATTTTNTKHAQVDMVVSSATGFPHVLAVLGLGPLLLWLLR